MGKMGNPFNVLPGYPERTVLLRIRKWKDNIKMNLKKHNGKMWTASGLQYGTVTGFCEYGGEALGSIKCRVFVDQMGN